MSRRTVLWCSVSDVLITFVILGAVGTLYADRVNRVNWRYQGHTVDTNRGRVTTYLFGNFLDSLNESQYFQKSEVFGRREMTRCAEKSTYVSQDGKKTPK